MDSPEIAPCLPRRGRKSDDPRMIGLWKMGRTIGKGSSGRVRIARHSKNGDYAAIKIVSKTSLINSRRSLHDIQDTDRIIHSIEREIVIMKLIDHPNIMRLYDVWETSCELYLILEYIEGGELFDYICEKGRLPAEEALDYFQQLVGAIDYCHRFNIAHRDLKPENLLLDTNKRLKVADFGMAAWQHGGSELLETACGSPHYAAPEVVRGEKYDGSSADIWSCGVILYALLAGRLPFDDEDILKLLDKVKLGKYTMPSDIEPGAKDLISRMLTKDVTKRIKMPEILAHPWYNSRPPSAPLPPPPTVELLSKPVASSEEEVDADIFTNLRTLWNGATDDVVIARLLNEERNWEKTIYRLLAEYRSRCKLNSDMEEEARREKEARRARRRQKRELEQQLLARSQPSRPDPPTPQRAATQRQAATAGRPSGRTRAKTISTPGGPASLPAPPEAYTLRPIAPFLSPDIQTIRAVPNTNTTSPLTPSLLSPMSLLSPTTNQSGTPMATPGSPMWDALSNLALPPIKADAPELQDENVQRFFREIAERMNGMGIHAEGTPNIRQLLSPVIAEPGLSALGLGIDAGTTTGETAPTASTAPLKISQKAAKGKDKENGAKNVVRSIFRRPSSKTSGEGGRPALAERRVQILLPPKIERTKEKAIEEENEDTAHSSGTSTTSSSSISGHSNGRRSWFANLFKPRSQLTHVLTSAHDSASSALDAAELIIIGLGAKVGIVEFAGVEMLKCELGEKKDPHGIMDTVRPVVFRVEIRVEAKARADASVADGVREDAGDEKRCVGGVSVVLTYERGSVAAFKLVCRKFEREWKTCEPEIVGGSEGKTEFEYEKEVVHIRVPSPVVGEGGRFVEGIGATVVCGY